MTVHIDELNIKTVVTDPGDHEEDMIATVAALSREDRHRFLQALVCEVVRELRDKGLVP
jgi:hypothetical protein